MPRIGFACMYRHPQQSLSLKELERIERTFNPQQHLRWMASAGARRPKRSSRRSSSTT